MIPKKTTGKTQRETLYVSTSALSTQQVSSCLVARAVVPLPLGTVAQQKALGLDVKLEAREVLEALPVPRQHGGVGQQLVRVTSYDLL